jgi:predicted RNase H-like nuclease (RuvC/YqgF family)
MNKADEIARSVGYDSISAFLAMFRRFASEPDLVIPQDLLDAVNVIERLMTEVDCLTAEVERLTAEVERLTAEVERLTDKIDDLKKVTAWNVALSADEVAALARGVNPDQIRPDAIVDLGRIA